VTLPTLHTEKTAAALLGVSAGTLRAERKAGRVAVTWIRSLPRYTDAALNDYLERSTEPCRDQPHRSASVTTSSSAGRRRRTGTPDGSTDEQVRPDAGAWALRIMTKRAAG